MSYILVNDIFDELKDENQRLKQSLNVFIRFKSFCDLIIDKLKSQLNSNDSQTYQKFSEEVNQVFSKSNDSVAHNGLQRTDSGQQEDRNDIEFITTYKIGLKSKLLAKRVKRGPKLKTNSGHKSENICDFTGCGKRYKTRDSLQHHRRKHTNKGLYTCEVEGCLWSSRCKKSFVGHTNGHKGIKPFECHYCEKRFTTEEYLKNHIAHLHQELDEPLVCGLDDCVKTFKTEKSLKYHQRNSHLKEKRFACDDPNCQFRGISEAVVKQHFFNVHSSERPFVCGLKHCAKAFKAADQLRNHMISHTPERPFKCSFEGCGKAFKAKTTMNKHWKHVHGDEVFSCDWPGCDYSTKNKNLLHQHKYTHVTERNYPCTWPECHKLFKRAHDLVTHLRIHTNDRRYACTWPGCQYRCTDNGNLTKHKRVHMK